MTRLAFLLVWPLTFAQLAFAQPAPTRIYRLGFISESVPELMRGVPIA